MTDSDPVIYENDELDQYLYQSQADLVMAFLNFLCLPDYFQNLSRLVESWKFTKARKKHIDNFGNTIQRGELYMSCGNYSPTRISLQSACGLWDLLCLSGWNKRIKEQYETREEAIQEKMKRAANEAGKGRWKPPDSNETED